LKQKLHDLEVDVRLKRREPQKYAIRSYVLQSSEELIKRAEDSWRWCEQAILLIHEYQTREVR
jgi:hypothetical protein